MFRKRDNRSDGELIRRGELLAGSLQAADAPDPVWARIEESLANRPGEAAPSKVPTYPWSRRYRIILAAAAATAVLFVAVLVPYRFGSRSGAWDVAALAGSPMAGRRAIQSKGRLEVGEWLETDARSRAQVKIANIGTLTVEPQTRLKIVISRPNEQRIRLAKGEMRADVKAPPRIFLVDTPSARAIDLGCLYTLTADDSGGSLLRVRAGSVAFDWRGRETLVPAGASCRTDPIRGPGVPRYEDSAAVLQNALDKLEGGTHGTAVASIVQNARSKDAISLWHALYKVEGAERAKIYDCLTSLVPPPIPIYRQAALRLDPMTLDLWKEAIRADILRREMEESLPSD